MLEYTYKERFCPTIRYSVSEDGKWLLVNGKNWGDRWQDFFWMAELNPDCSYVSVSGLKYKIAAICLGAVSVLFRLLTLLVWGEEHFSFRPESFSNCLFILNIALVFAIFATVMFFRWKKNHGIFLCFSSFLRSRSLSILLPYGTKLQEEPFVRELRKKIAEQFLYFKPDLSRPEQVEQLRKAYDSLREDRILTEREYNELNRKVFSGMTVRRNIGFIVE